jgi:hypothetical protein
MFESIKDRLTGDKNPNDLEALKLLNAYRSVFAGSLEGSQVLAHLLTDLGLFNELQANEEEVSLHNAAIRILARLGIINGKNIQAIIDALLDLPVKLT